MNYKIWFWAVNIFTALLRLLFIGRIGLSVDEAHYWVYTKFLDFSYFDHPPVIAYLIKVSTLIFGNTAFAVRFPAVVIFFFTSWLFFICVKKLYNERTAFTGVVLLNVLPVFSFLGSVISIPDSPLALFWILALLVFILIIETNNKKYWYLLGVITGFAMLSKYNAFMIPVSVTLFLILSPKHRFWFKEKEPYIALLISIIMFTPVILWNIANNWASFGFQMRHGLGSSLPKLSFTTFSQCLGAQAGYISPPIFLVFIAAAYLCVKEAFVKKDRTALLIACFSLPILIFFNFIATFNEILPHWPAMGYLILSIYVAHITLKYADIKWFKIYNIIAWSFTVLLMLLAYAHIMYKVIPVEKFLPKEQAEKIRYGIPEAERVDVTNDVFGWEELGNEIRRRLAEYPPKEKPFIFTHKSYLASQIAFAVPEARVFCFSDRIDAYDIWQRDLRPLRNKNALFICNDMFYFDPARYGDAFESYSEPSEFSVYRNGKKIRNFFFTDCKKFKPANLPEQYSANILGPKKIIFDELLSFDHAVFKFINSYMRCKFFDFYIAPISYFDSKDFNIGLTFILILSIVIMWNNKKDSFWTNLALLASVLVVSSVITYFLKQYFERLRPLAFFGDENVNTLYEHIHGNSFPSGHTQAAFAACTFMFLTVRKYWYWYLFLAFATAFERIYAGSHFPSDVLAGALIGYFTATIMVKLFKKYSRI
ncbi:MAG: glycosyltransferase family 39 protein [Endomicrobia bacterium]|nr:glycosyltransferase family 39 protein [Endomicrobiia bacterium]MCL2800031.1 glycosyltransferase family 39 protein [Endomicrobiia bacterium]